MNAVIERTRGFVWADAGETTVAIAKAARKIACEMREKRYAELPLLRNIRPSPPADSKVRRNSRNALADDQAMNVVRALVGVDRFEVVHVAHDAVVVNDAVGSQNVARLA